MEYIIGFFMFVLGAIMSSFYGVVAYRVPKKISIVKPNSYCPSCMTELKWYDNIPIIGYIILGGRCRYCKNKIGVVGFLMEIIGGLSFLFAYIFIKDIVALVLSLLIISFLLIIAYEDFETNYILDLFQILLAIAAIGYVVYTSIILNTFCVDSFIGLLVGGIFFLLIKLFGLYVLKKDILGTGDVILITIIGFLVGYKKLLIVLLVASFVGSVVEIIKMKVTKKEGEVAFGPYLALGGYVGLVFGDLIINLVMEVINNAFI